MQAQDICHEEERGVADEFNRDAALKVLTKEIRAMRNDIDELLRDNAKLYEEMDRLRLAFRIFEALSDFPNDTLLGS